MKTKIIILTPVYNDWKNLTRLLAKINNIFKFELKKKFDLIIVNDCSTEKFNYKISKFKYINVSKIISLKKNVGSQRALAIGIKYINKKYKKNYKTIIIDSDGQDNPIGIKKLIKKSGENSVVVDRGQRKEPFWFRFFYMIYTILLKLFTAKNLKFGNFCLLNSEQLKKINDKSDLWNALPPTILNNVKKIIHITIDREKRFTGESKMNFIGLLFHAFRVFSVFRKRIFISSLIYISSTFIIFHQNEYKFIFFTVFVALSLFNLLILIVTIFNKINYHHFITRKNKYY